MIQIGNSIGISAISGFFFGIGMILAAFLMKALLRISICG